MVETDPSLLVARCFCLSHSLRVHYSLTEAVTATAALTLSEDHASNNLNLFQFQKFQQIQMAMLGNVKIEEIN